MRINANNLDSKDLNELVKNSKDKNIEITNMLGQRYIGAGSSDLNINISGIPGNALGAYLNGSKIEVTGNSSDALGDTMNDGEIIIHGNSGDTCGYAMRGGKIYVRGNVGYRCGIHMKAYMDKFPIIIVGGSAGSFLGEYQAGGIIVVLGLDNSEFSDGRIIGNFASTGMYGGKLYIRHSCENDIFPESVDVKKATNEDLLEIKDYLEEYSKIFKINVNELLNHEYTLVTPNHDKKPKVSYVGN